MQAPNTIRLRRKGEIVATISPTWTGEAYRFTAELHGVYAGIVVTHKRLSDAMDWAELATSDLAQAA